MLEKLQEIKLPIDPNSVLDVTQYISNELVIVMKEGEIRKLFETWREKEMNFHLSTLINIIIHLKLFIKGVGKNLRVLL